MIPTMQSPMQFQNMGRMNLSNLQPLPHGQIPLEEPGDIMLGQPKPKPSNIMSGLPPDIINKVLKDVMKSVSQTVSMQAQEALQQGASWGNVIEDLIKMAPPGMNLMGGGGSPPPGGPNDLGGGGGNKPPQGPTPVQDDQSFQDTSGGFSNSPQMSNLQLNRSPYQQGRAGFEPNSINAALLGQGQSQPTQNNPRVISGGIFSKNKMLPSGDMQVGGAFSDFLGPNMEDLIAGQKFIGQEPYQSGEQQKDVQAALKAFALKDYEQDRLDNRERIKVDAEAMNPKLAGESSTKFALAMEGKDATEEIAKILFTNPSDASGRIQEMKFTPDFFKSDVARDLQLRLMSIIDARTRFETGATLGKGEREIESKKMMPRLNESPQIYAKRIQRNGLFFERGLRALDPKGHLEARIRSGESGGERTGLIAEAKKRGLM